MPQDDACEDERIGRRRPEGEQRALVCFLGAA